MARTQRLQGGLNLALVIVATVVIAVVLNILLGGLRARFDLTENQVNVLSEASRAAVSELDSELTIKVFISPDLPESIPMGPGGQSIRLQGVPQKLRDKIDEYKAYGDNLSVVDVTEDVVAEGEKAKIKALTGEGASLSNGRLELKRYVLGVSFGYKNQTEVFDAALEPEYFEFEITKRIMRLKDKAESALTMKDVLAAGKDLAAAGATCTKALEDAAGPDDDSNNALAMMLNPEAAEGKVAALKAAATKFTEACNLTGVLTKAKALEKKNAQLDRLYLFGEALDKETKAFTAALAAPGEAPQGGQVMQTHTRLVAIGNGLKGEYDELTDAPGRRRIGFVCNAITFCPFPDDKKLIPDEIKGAIMQQNPILQNVLPVFDRIQQDMNGLLTQVNQGLFKSRGFDIARVDLDEDIPDDIQAMVVYGAKSTFSEYQLYQMDQFVMRGGSLIAFLFPFDVKMQLMNTKGELDESGTLAKNSSNIDDLLAGWGIKPTKKLIVDATNNGEVVLYAQVEIMGRGLVQQAGFPYPALPTFKEFDTTDPLVRSTTSLTLPYATSLELTPKPGVELTALVKSGAEALQIDDPAFPVYPPQAQEQALAGKTGEGPLTVVATAKGTLESYFKGKAAPAKPSKADDKEDAVKDASKDMPGVAQKLDSGVGRVLVIGSNLGLLPLSSDAIFEGFNLGMIAGEGGGIENFEKFRGYQMNFQNWQLRIGQVQHTLQSNLQFLQNALDWSVQREGLAELRSKQYAPRPLSVMDSGQKSFMTALGLLLPTALVLAFGAIWFARRKSRTKSLAF